ncbi:MAG: FKBP-type peptidyl-prolyl cis-trans isomerase [Anaplasmataceae bacterium]|nr:FKBP-type peptidyl-prolyl cis-trans isomerase [Anaplasmataceae bacterium]
MKELEFTNNRDKASYCLGLETGRGLKVQFADLDLNVFSQGLKDAFHDAKPKMKEEEIRQVMAAIQHQMIQQQRQMLAKLSDENKKAAEKFLEHNKTQPGITTLPSGLEYRVIVQKTTGASPTMLDVVTIHYKASFPNGTVFEDTYEKNQPKTLGINQMISGWSEALKLMKPGEKWEIYVPPYLAYGEAGFPPVIPPNALLIFELELLSVNQELPGL